MNNNNNMFCDIDAVSCGIDSEKEMELTNLNIPKNKIDLYYFTDPMCSHCWAFEPVIRRFKAQYGHYFNFSTFMGGLLKNWDGFSDSANGISVPSDVASHWREVGEHTRMPIDGSLWFDNPIVSSYPVSRVFKVINQKNEKLAKVFLRKAREAVFPFNQNIGEEKVLIEIVNNLGMNGEEVVKESTLSKSQELLEEDFAFGRKLGAEVFPTIIMVNKESKAIKIVGARSFNSYVDGLSQLFTEKEELKPLPQPSLSTLLENNTKLFSREIEEMYDLKQNEVIPFIEKNLSPSEYEIKEILGEVYIRSKNQVLLKEK
ncbi:DsbA family protein [Clostridium estertheticum]|uniref:DsbA family protein n=1 Tax=Clostridium estertheticum TaxID=238834 RepID=UPI0013E90D23|nr:DsbA family protein [Clostridium estertheticum]MBZ9685798.1 DsbA family protein [Clostridium estertheticum]